MSTQYDFRILGSLEVWDGEHRLTLGGARQRAVLGTLLLHAGETVSVAALTAAVWGDAAPERAAAALRSLVSTLRRTLEPGRTGGGSSLLAAGDAGYRLCVEPGQVDRCRFEQLVEQGRHALATDPVTASALLHEAGALWRGPALGDVALTGAAADDRSRLDGLRVAAVEDRIQADLELGRHAIVVAELEALAAAHPTRERLHALRMLALHRCGDEAGALAAYGQAQAHLDPSPDLRSLERAIAERDPGLAAPDTAPAGTVIAATVVAAAPAAPTTPGTAVAGPSPAPRPRRSRALTGAVAAVIAGGCFGGLGLHSLRASTSGVPARAAAPVVAVDTFPTTDEQRLIGQFGPAVTACQRYPHHYARALADVECRATGDHPGAGTVVLQSFATYADLEMHFHHVLALTIQGETGRPVSAAYHGDCADPGSGFFALSNHQRPNATTPNGHLICYADHTGLPHLAWTDVSRLVVAQTAGVPGPADQAQSGLLCFWHGLYPDESSPAPVAAQVTATQVAAAAPPAPVVQVTQAAPAQRPLAPTPTAAATPRPATPARTGTASPAATPAPTPAGGRQGNGWDQGWKGFFGSHGHD